VSRAQSPALIRFYHLLAFKVQCRIKSEASANYLGFLWWVLEPLLHLLTFYLVFEVLMNRGTEHYVAFLVSGLIPWLWFSKSVSNASGALFNQRGLLMLTRLPIALLPSEVVFQDLVKQGAVFALLITFLLLYGIAPTATWLALIPLVVIQLVLIAAVAFALAALVPLVPDLRFFIQTGLMLMMFGSGIFYSPDLILPEHRELFFMNPMAALIQSYRDALLEGVWPEWGRLGWIFLSSAVALAGMIWFFVRRADFYPRLVSEI
jgi:lipopolysaccharide transport system permease protein